MRPNDRTAKPQALALGLTTLANLQENYIENLRKVGVGEYKVPTRL